MNGACNQLLTSYNLVQYGSLADNDLCVFQRDGSVTCTYVEDAYKDWLNMMHQWYDEGLYDPDFISISYIGFGGQDETLLSEGNLGVWWGNINAINNYYAMSPDEDFDMTIAFIPATDDPMNHVVDASLLFAGAGGINGTALSATCSQPEIAMGWLDFWYGQEGYMLANYGIEGEVYEMVDGQVEYTDLILKNAYDLDPSTVLNLYAVAGTAFGIQSDARTWPFFSDVQLLALTEWTDPIDSAWVYPDATLNTAESDVLSAKLTDITTYIAESVPKFINGDLDVNTQWEDFQATLESMGIYDCLAAYQSALDRYNR